MKKDFIGTGIIILLMMLLGTIPGNCQQVAATAAPLELLVPDPVTANLYINIYQAKFTRAHNMNHTKFAFLDSNYFKYLDTFFTSPANKSYDGIRIYFLSYNKIIDNTQQARKKEITLALAPTINKEGKLDVFHARGPAENFFLDVLNHGELCPNSCDGPGMVALRKSEKKDGTNKAADDFMFLSPEDCNGYIKNYRRKYDFLWNRKHSKSMWINKNFFTFLGEFFRTTQIKYDGIRIYFAAYDKIIPEVNNRRKKQITLLFAAANRDAKREVNFNALYDFYTHHTQLLPANYGELCPNNCDLNTP